MLELAELIWTKIKGDDVPFRCVSDTPFEHDVQRRVPGDREGARRSSASRRRPALDDMLDEVIPWIAAAVADGRI